MSSIPFSPTHSTHLSHIWLTPKPGIQDELFTLMATFGTLWANMKALPLEALKGVGNKGK